jgi:hypothetical protein
MPRSTRTALATLLASALAVAAGPTSALCTDGRHPTLQAEFADSDIVASGKAGFLCIESLYCGSDASRDRLREDPL